MSYTVKYGLDGKLPRHHTHCYHIRLKWPADIREGALVYDCNVEEKREESLHSVCSSIIPLRVSANRGYLAQELMVSLFRRFGMCYKVSYISYKMILRYLPRWMDRVLNLLNVPCVFSDSVGKVLFTSVCRILLQYIAKILKGIRKSFAVDLPHFSHCSHISQQYVRECGASILPLLACTHYLAS